VSELAGAGEDVLPGRVRGGGRLVVAALSGLGALALSFVFFDPGPYLRGAVTFTAGAVVGASLVAPLVWGRLAARPNGLSWAGAVLAGVLIVPLAGLVMGLVAWATIAVAGLVDPELGGPAGHWLSGLPEAGMLAFMIAFMTTLRAAPLAFPLAISASLAANLWCRRRLQVVGLPSYPSGRGGGQ